MAAFAGFDAVAVVVVAVVDVPYPLNPVAVAVVVVRIVLAVIELVSYVHGGRGEAVAVFFEHVAYVVKGKALAVFAAVFGRCAVGRAFGVAAGRYQLVQVVVALLCRGSLALIACTSPRQRLRPDPPLPLPPKVTR